QERLAEQIARDGLSVREAEQLVRGETEARAEEAEEEPEQPQRREPGQVREPAVLELEELLSARLDTRVHVSLGASRGKIVVEFADLDDLERIYRVITPPGTEI